METTQQKIARLEVELEKLKGGQPRTKDELLATNAPYAGYFRFRWLYAKEHELEVLVEFGWKVERFDEGDEDVA